MDELHELCDTLHDAVREANDKIRQAGGKLTGDDLTYIDKLTHSLKSVKAVIAMGDNTSHRMKYNGFAEQLKNLLPDAPDDKTRMDIKRLIERL